MKKTIYTAPDVEQMEIRFEENIMSAKAAAAPNMTTHNSDEWGDWE